MKNFISSVCKDLKIKKKNKIYMIQKESMMMKSKHCLKKIQKILMK